MIHARFTQPYKCDIRIDAKWNQPGKIKVKGKDKETVKKLIVGGRGLFGHIIQEETTPAALFEVLLKLSKRYALDFVHIPRKHRIQIQGARS